MGDDTLLLFTIYNSPRDYPGWFVVREWCIMRGGKQISNGVMLATTLDEARALLPVGLYNLGRNPEDDPVIVESWV